jgi:hypothetical protein
MRRVEVPPPPQVNHEKIGRNGDMAPLILRHGTS